MLTGMTAIVLPATNTPGAWIGLRDINSVSSWRWIFKNLPLTQAFWATGQPVVGNGCARYMAVLSAVGSPVPASAANSWQSAVCTATSAFICEMEPPCSLVVNASPPIGK
jgi:hypothetical protein